MADLFEILLVDGGTRWHAGWVVDDATETDVLLRDGTRVPVFASRAGLEHFLQSTRMELQDDLPDEVDLDLSGWLSRGTPEPPLAEVSELWHVLIDDPAAGKALAGEVVGEAYDDLVEQEPDWFATHGPAARRALSEAVRHLRGVLHPA